MSDLPYVNIFPTACDKRTHDLIAVVPPVTGPPTNTFPRDHGLWTGILSLTLRQDVIPGLPIEICTSFFPPSEFPIFP